MDTNSIMNILAAIGGTGVVVGALAAWLGKVWATRIADGEKARHEQDLARLTSALEVEKARVDSALGQLAESQKQLLQASVQIDLDLRNRRFEVYREIWKRTEILPKWPRDEKVTYADLEDFSESLRDWYFNEGGMFLSTPTREKGYGPLQDAIAAILENKPEGPLKPEHYDKIRKHCSQLRTRLTNDILSRREAPASPEPV